MKRLQLNFVLPALQWRVAYTNKIESSETPTRTGTVSVYWPKQKSLQILATYQQWWCVCAQFSVIY